MNANVPDVYLPSPPCDKAPTIKRCLWAHVAKGAHTCSTPTRDALIRCVNRSVSSYLQSVDVNGDRDLAKAGSLNRFSSLLMRFSEAGSVSLGVAVLASCSDFASATDTLESLLSTYSRLMLETQLALVADRQGQPTTTVVVNDSVPDEIVMSTRRGMQERKTEPTPAVVFSFQVVAGSNKGVVKRGAGAGTSLSTGGIIVDASEVSKVAKRSSALHVIEAVSLAIVNLLLASGKPSNHLDLLNGTSSTTARSLYNTACGLMQLCDKEKGTAIERARVALLLFEACLEANPSNRASSMRDIYFSVVKEAEECTYTTTFVDCVVQLTAKAFATAESLYPSSSTIATNEAWPCILNLFLSLEGCQGPTRAEEFRAVELLLARLAKEVGVRQFFSSVLPIGSLPRLPASISSHSLLRVLYSCLMHSVKRSTTTRSNNDADGEGVWLPLVGPLLDLLLGLGDHSSRILSLEQSQACSQGQHDIESDTNSVASCLAFAEAEFINVGNDEEGSTAPDQASYELPSYMQQAIDATADVLALLLFKQGTFTPQKQKQGQSELAARLTSLLQGGIATASAAASLLLAMLSRLDRNGGVDASACLPNFKSWLGTALVGINQPAPLVRKSCMQTLHVITPWAPLARQKWAAEREQRDKSVAIEESVAMAEMVLAQAAPQDITSTPADASLVKVLRSKLSADLRQYQWTGVSWLTYLRRCGLGGILADEMGLGKTLSALTSVAVQVLGSRQTKTQQGSGSNGKEYSSSSTLACLVVCPTSLVLHWEHEIRKFFPGPEPLLTPLRYEGKTMSIASMLNSAAEKTARAAGQVTGAYAVVVIASPLITHLPYLSFNSTGTISYYVASCDSR